MNWKRRGRTRSIPTEFLARHFFRGTEKTTQNLKIIGYLGRDPNHVLAEYKSEAILVAPNILEKHLQERNIDNTPADQSHRRENLRPYRHQPFCYELSQRTYDHEKKIFKCPDLYNFTVNATYFIWKLHYMFQTQRVIIRCCNLCIQLLNCNVYIYICIHVLLKWLKLGLWFVNITV
jgi:hypothetical protein